MDGTSTITNWNEYSQPEFISAREWGETVEFIYKERSQISHTIQPQDRVFKIVYSCKNGHGINRTEYTGQYSRHRKKNIYLKNNRRSQIMHGAHTTAVLYLIRLSGRGRWRVVCAHIRRRF